ncbi:MAG: nitroreductase family protein [Burkholderiaceae bacterium]
MTTRPGAGIAMPADAATPTASGPPHPAGKPLPPPHRTGGMPLLQALDRRRSTRAFDRAPLALQTLSDLLWAAGSADQAGDARTAPRGSRAGVIDVLVALEDGVWRYDAGAHALERHCAADLRARTGFQDFAAWAPVELVYVAHGERMPELEPAQRRLRAAVEAAFIGQDVYLFCASGGLATVFRGALDRDGLARALRLPEQQFVTFAQTVGRAGPRA